MVVHLGRLKLVVRRKRGKCVYKHCPKSQTVMPGDKVFILTKMGSLPTRTGPVVFYKAFHRECFPKWADWVYENQTPQRDGRPTMDLDPKVKEHRAKLVRERARILRSLRRATTDNLESKAERIGELDKLIAATGYPIVKYKGRRSRVIVDLDKFVKEVKAKYGSEMRVPRSIFDKAINMGVEGAFRLEMDKWRQDEHERARSSTKHYEDTLEDKEVE